MARQFEGAGDQVKRCQVMFLLPPPIFQGISKTVASVSLSTRNLLASFSLKLGLGWQKLLSIDKEDEPL